MRKITIFLVLVGLALGFAIGCSARSTLPGGNTEKPGGGIAWKWDDLQAGKAQAAKEGKKIFLYIGGNY